MIKRLILNISLASLLSCSSATTLENNFPEYEVKNSQNESEKHIFSLLKEYILIESRDLSFGWGRVEMLTNYSGKRLYHIRFNAPEFIDPGYRLERFGKNLKNNEHVPREDVDNYSKFIEKYKNFEFEFEGKKYSLNKETLVLTRNPSAIYVLIDTDNDKNPDRIIEEIKIDEYTGHLLEIEIGKLR